MCPERNEQLSLGKDKMKFLYVLYHASELRMKIGITDLPARRVKELKLNGKLDLTRSHQLELPQKIAKYLEKILHYIYIEYRVDMPLIEGYTEWFHTDCYHKVHRHLEYLAAEYNYSFENLNTTVPVEFINTVAQNEEKIVKSDRSKRKKPVRLENADGFDKFIKSCSPFLFLLDFPHKVHICFNTKNEREVKLINYWFDMGVSEPDNSIDGNRKIPNIRLRVTGRTYSENIVNESFSQHDPNGSYAVGYIILRKPCIRDLRVPTRIRNFIFGKFKEYGIPIFLPVGQAGSS